MKVFTKLKLRARSVFRRNRVENELDRELEFHVDQQTGEYAAAGMDPVEARHAALRSVGNTGLIKDQARETWGLRIVHETLQDLRYAVRSFARAPGSTIIIVLTLALGIGGATAVFSVADGVLFDPMNFPESDRLVRMRGSWGYDDLRALQRDSRTLESVGWYRGVSVSVTGLGEPERIRGEYVSSSYFDVLGIHPELGKPIAPGEDVPGGDLTVVLSHRYWERRFASDPEILGKTIYLNNSAHTIVGVMPPDFRSYWDGTEAWISPQTMPYGGLTEESAGYWTPIGRRGEDVGMAAAQDEMRQFLIRQLDVSAADDRLAVPQLLPLSTAIVSGELRQLVFWLLGAVVLVLLIATANVAGLQLARAARRSEEMAIRRALGGGRRRLLRQLLAESLALAVLGGGLGVLVSAGVLRVLAAESLSPFTRFDIELSVLALCVAASVTLGAGLLSGIAPALRGSRTESGSELRTGDRAEIGSRGTSRFRSRLVMAQMAMAVTLLVGASLLLRTASALNQFDVGFDAENLLTGETRLTSPMYQDEDTRRAYLQQVVQRLSAIPGVEGATLMKGMPFAGDADFTRVRNEGADLDWDDAQLVYSPPVAEGYFDFMGIPVLAGRPFERTDGPAAERVFVVSQSFADAFFDGASPVGRMIETADGPGRVVGVVQNSRRDFTTAQGYEPVLYEHYLQDPPDFFSVLIRTQGAPESYQRSLLEAFWEVDPNQPLWEVLSLRQRMVDVTRNQRFFSVLLGGFSALALILSGVGLYGVMTQSVGSRQRELGVRIALGANRSCILQMVLGQAIVLTSTGLLVGIGGAVLGARLLGSVLFGIEPFDLLSFVLAPVVLVAASIVAAYLPARRATRVDPVVAIRA